MEKTLADALNLIDIRLGNLEGQLGAVAQAAIDRDRKVHELLDEIAVAVRALGKSG